MVGHGVVEGLRGGPLDGGRSVAVLALAKVAPFELSVACEVFRDDRVEYGVPAWDFAVCGLEPGFVPTKAGFDIHTRYGLDRVDTADIVIVPNWSPAATAVPPAAALAAVQRAAARGAWVISFCTGAFVLAHAGLLDGRRATTHWQYADDFRALFPAVDLRPDVLYVADGPVLTSAGTAAAIDLSLHVLRVVDGPEAANASARQMIVPPHRDGGQAQYVDRPMPAEDDCALADLLLWMNEHLDRDQSVDELAERVHMSPRTFARRFRAETGTTPHHWLTGQRVLHAQRLLESTDLAVERIAEQAGLGSAATLRHHFTGWVGVSPQRYRAQFRRTAAAV
jgi:AraC family transcriptional regulator, transcriptional activator FtrA